MKVIKTVLRAFILGLGVGILVAPRAGSETRQMLSEKFDNLLNNISGAGAGGADTSTGGFSSAGVIPSQHYAEGTTSALSEQTGSSGTINI
jgi:gas vesicle protein